MDIFTRGKRNLRIGPIIAIAAVLSGCAGLSGAPTAYCRNFAVAGVEHVIIRAERAAQAEVVAGADPDIVRVCGLASGGAAGYHPSDPNWRETAAEDWGLGLKAKRFGTVLVVSSYNEIEYIHHYYSFDSLRVESPEGVTVTLEGRTLNGDGEADLTPP